MQLLNRPPRLTPFVESVMLLENQDADKSTNLPFYAEGYPGIVYAETAHPVTFLPRGKTLSDFYLYGQTLKPMSLQLKGAYRMLAFRLYPFAVRVLLGIHPRELNDDCYDLLQLKHANTKACLEQLADTDDVQQQLSILTDFINKLVKYAAKDLDKSIQLATNSIIHYKGDVTIKNLRSQLYISERTFERRFASEIGVTPKQFAKIIQFSYSRNQITEEDYTHLTEIAHNSGFADQSHFIRTFKRYTGKTPKEYQRQLSV